MNSLVEQAVERCLATPDRREMVFSPSYRRSALLFRDYPRCQMEAWRTTLTWKFPNGSRITFGYLGSEEDAHRYLGMAWDQGTCIGECDYAAMERLHHPGIRPMFKEKPMIARTFAYHKPSESGLDRISYLRRMFSDLKAGIEFVAPASRERSVALTELESAAMWAIKAVVANDPTSVVEDTPTSQRVLRDSDFPLGERVGG